MENIFKSLLEIDLFNNYSMFINILLYIFGREQRVVPEHQYKLVTDAKKSYIK